MTPRYSPTPAQIKAACREIRIENEARQGEAYGHDGSYARQAYEPRVVRLAFPLRVHMPSLETM